MTHNVTITPKEKSAVEISGELPFEHLEKHRKNAVSHLAQGIQIDGFRKGHIPENVLVERIGEMALLEEMALRALRGVYPTIIEENELDVIGQPQITLTKLAKDNPLGFTIMVATLPEVTLPDYKKIAKDINAKRETDEVSDEEVDKQIEDILRQKAAYERMQNKAQAETKEEAEAEDELKIPELTDDVVKTLGQPGQFETVADFKAKIREHLEIQKKDENLSKHRAKITDAIIEETKVELPQVMIDAELGQMFAQMEQDLTRAGLKIDDYLGHMKKTREDLIKEWSPSAEKRAKLQLVLNEIAKKEDIKPEDEKLKSQTAALMEQYKDADEMRVRIYVASVLTNEAVMAMLEGQ